VLEPDLPADSYRQLLSLDLATVRRVPPIAKSTITVSSIRTAAACKQRTGLVLYWRPIVPGWNDSPRPWPASWR